MKTPIFWFKLIFFFELNVGCWIQVSVCHTDLSGPDYSLHCLRLCRCGTWLVLVAPQNKDFPKAFLLVKMTCGRWSPAHGRVAGIQWNTITKADVICVLIPSRNSKATRFLYQNDDFQAEFGAASLPCLNIDLAWPWLFHQYCDLVRNAFQDIPGIFQYWPSISEPVTNSVCLLHL